MAMSMGAARRGKPKIRPPKRPTSETPIKDTWTKLANAIREIQNHNASKLSYEEHYRYGYNMVLHKHGDQLYNGVKALISEYLDRLAEEKIVPTFPRSGGTRGAGKLGGGAEAIERALEGDRFLKAIKSAWEDHTGSMRKIRDILKYMDKGYSTANGLPLIYDVGLTLFLLHIIRSSKYPIHTHLISTLLSQVQLERDGETITRSTIRECTDILLRLHVSEREGGKNVYLMDFEPEFLNRSAEFYELEAIDELDKGDAASYLRRVEHRLAEEADRTVHYLSTVTHNALQELLVANLLTPHLQTILDMPGSGLVTMLDSDRISDLRRLYVLFLKVPKDQGKTSLRNALRLDIEERGKAVNQERLEQPGPSTLGQDDDGAAEDGKGKGKEKAKTISPANNALNSALKWVQDVLELKDKFDGLLESAFMGDKQVQVSINEAFQSFINANPRAPEYLSLFIDENLKKGTKARSDSEIESALEKTIVLFRFLSDKDKFERYYKNHLARRLLYARSASDDSEKQMVTKLKMEMGFQFTQKLEGMFTDMRLSNESANTFRNYLTRHGALPIDLIVNVLTASYWPQPIVATTTCTFPAALQPSMETFQKYYDSRHSGRRLTWQGNLGTADVKVRFKNRAHDLNLSTQALVVLLLFENTKSGETLSYPEIKTSTDLPDPDLIRTLQSLACGKFRVLTKIPKGRDINPTDKFEFNESFTSPLARIKIMQVASKVESTKEREETQEMVDEERRHQVEACIVRIMKDRKQMSHNDLISEVAHQLSTRFSPSMSLIKKRIEGLIDREYLERTSDMGSYRYLA
ncbi:Cullin 3 [Kwoniella mangroviensis CBS 10435]|uniref:Cullin 3 n=1 Tax=Kwoniella mangroviensis CBS 10435 TaxID=1331196 RepID=A0A1B9J193_9TREE|nr:Cullin 3 [Kwoniella mangroviensis CBS 8507]OCF61551.1 Cullin 3 [Kwoniella mangroviensis CBS 10435]OCF63404.1 Cullin 3 [Kwoniella mangroviensis CBS 8507]OCF77575.1 Cullin 3 [Kwoniella mangroviensis CBS 8886]